MLVMTPSQYLKHFIFFCNTIFFHTIFRHICFPWKKKQITGNDVILIELLKRDNALK